MSKNVIIAIVVIVIIIAGIIWFMNQTDATDVDIVDDGGEMVDIGDNSGSFTTDGDGGAMDAGADIDAEVSL
jgi:uncharacterized membrane protein YqiK